MISFEVVKDHYSDLIKSSEIHNFFINELFDFYKNSYDPTVRNFQKVFEFYNYKNRNNFLGRENEIPILSFVTSIGEAKIDLCLTYMDGVASSIFSKCLIEDPYNESWREKITSAGDAFDPIYHDYSNVIFFYFISTIWKNLDFNRHGLISQICGYANQYHFILNDLMWREESIFMSDSLKYPLEHYSLEKFNDIEILNRFLFRFN